VSFIPRLPRLEGVLRHYPHYAVFLSLLSGAIAAMLIVVLGSESSIVVVALGLGGDSELRMVVGWRLGKLCSG
jgi:hypothetical protein